MVPFLFLAAQISACRTTTLASERGVEPSSLSEASASDQHVVEESVDVAFGEMSGSATLARSLSDDLDPEEEIDLEMAAERADEENLLDELDAASGDVRGGARVRSILAVTGTVTFDIPMIENQLTDQWISYMLGRGRKWYAIWLSRSTRVVPGFREILTHYGLPIDLVFLAMIESGFSPNAYSWAHAAGPWQFMPHTGRRFGLAVDFWLDERRDFERSTHAAAKYLSVLYKEFGDWYLAWAAYNAGEARVRRAIRSAGTRDWWKLSKTRYLRRETRHYVPKLLAAAIVAKSPERFGFQDVEYLPPLKWDVLSVTTSVDLATIARACGDGVDESVLKDLNPALRRSVTPPGGSYELRVPVGSSAPCSLGLAALPERDRMTYRYHQIRRGETPVSLAKTYETTPEAILAFNNVGSPRQLAQGCELVIPIPQSKDAMIPVMKPPIRDSVAASSAPGGAQAILHRVRPGESLWSISQRYRVPLNKLCLWNGIWRSSRLQIGQVVRIYKGRRA